MTYFFRPAPPAVLAQFGIRYCITSGPKESLEQLGWVLRAQVTYTDKYAGWLLFESPVSVTPFYFVGEKGSKFLQEYRLAGDKVEIDLSPLVAAGEVVATFVAPFVGWESDGAVGAETPIIVLGTEYSFCPNCEVMLGVIASG